MEGGYLNFTKKLEEEEYQWESILMTYNDLLPHLIANQFVKPIVLEPLTPPFLEWYNPDAHCEYHARVLGHSIEDCALSKDEVQKLIESGVLSFTVM